MNQDSYLGEANTPPSLHRYLYAYANPLVYVDLHGYLSVLEKDVDKVMRLPNDKPFHFNGDSNLMNLSSAAGIEPNYFLGSNYLNPEQVQQLKRLVQNGIGRPTADSCHCNTNPAFIYRTEEDTDASLAFDVKKMVGGYLSENDLKAAISLAQNTPVGGTANLSYYRTEAVAALQENSGNHLTEAYGNDLENRPLVAMLEKIGRSAEIAFDTNAPDDIASEAIKDTAWNFAPFLGPLSKVKNFARFGRGISKGGKPLSFSGGKPTLTNDSYSPDLVNQRSAEFYKLYGDNPLRGTMSNYEARQWYLAEDAQILNRIDSTASLEAQARQAFDIRNSNRTQARELMYDRVSADRLYREEPNLTWDQIIQLKQSQGLSGDDVYRSILQSSQKTRAEVNRRYGLE